MLDAASRVVGAVGLQDGIGFDDFLAFFAGIVTMLTATALLSKSRPWRDVKAMLAWLHKFQRDWEGEPAEENRKHIPGVMERLNRMDGELSPNGGESGLDLIRATAAKVSAMNARQQDIDVKVDGALETVAGLVKGQEDLVEGLRAIREYVDRRIVEDALPPDHHTGG
jgi:hypothetical protein